MPAINMGPVDLSSEMDNNNNNNKPSGCKDRGGGSRAHQGFYQGDLESKPVDWDDCVCDRESVADHTYSIYEPDIPFGVTPQDRSSPSGGERSSDKVGAYKPCDICNYQVPQSQGASSTLGMIFFFLSTNTDMQDCSYVQRECSMGQYTTCSRANDALSQGSCHLYSISCIVYMYDANPDGTSPGSHKSTSAYLHIYIYIRLSIYM